MAYKDFKSYIQANYKQLLTEKIRDFVNKNHDGLGFHSFGVLSLLDQKVENLEVRSLTCHDDIGPRIKIDVHTRADIVQMGLGTKSYEADRKTRWFTVYLKGLLMNGLTGVEVVDVDEYHAGKFDKENALDTYLIPYIYRADLEDQADDFTEFYCSDAVYDGYKLPVDHILQEFGANCYTADLPDDCFGRIYFKESTATIYEKNPQIAKFQALKNGGRVPQISEDGLLPGEYKVENHKIEPGDILISRQKFFMGKYGSYMLTFAHEIIHWYLHKKYYKLLSLLDEEADEMSCEVEPSYYDENMTVAQKAHWFAAWQANALAIRIVMPQNLFVQALNEAKVAALQQPHLSTGLLIEDILSRTAELFGVSVYAVKQRARQLGWDGVDGAFVYVDGVRYWPFWFQEGILDLHQSFVIDRKGYEKLYQTDPDFAQLIDSGQYLYLGYVVCKAEPKYITVDFKYGGPEFRLSDYAQEHADECCLVFDWKSTTHLKDEYEFYGQAFLSQQVTAARDIEYTYDKNFNYKDDQSDDEIAEEVAKYNAALDAKKNVKIEMMQNNCNTFADTLIYHMDRKDITVDNLVERSGLSDTTIKAYRAGRKTPGIENTMAVCIGLNLPRAYSLDMIKKAGCSIESDTPQNRAYNMCLDYSDGTIDQWNRIITKFGVDPIPNTRNQAKN